MLSVAAILFALLGLVSSQGVSIPPRVYVEIVKDVGYRIFTKRIPELNNFTVYARTVEDDYDYRSSFFEKLEVVNESRFLYLLHRDVDELRAIKSIEYLAYFDLNYLGYFKKEIRDADELDVVTTVNDTLPLPSTMECPSSITEFGYEDLVRNDYCVDELVYNEEFNDIPRKFSIERRMPNVYNKEYGFAYYDKRAIEIINGNVEIKVQKNLESNGRVNLTAGCTGVGNVCYGEKSPMVYTGKLVSKFNIKYGKIVIRAKMPEGKWIYSDLILTSSKNEKKEVGLVRVALVRGNENLSYQNRTYDRRTLEGGIQLDRLEKCLKPPYILIHPEVKNWTKSYHDYAIVWKSDSMEFLVDDIPYGKIEVPKDYFQMSGDKCKRKVLAAPFNEPMILSLSVGVGGPSTFPDDKTIGKPWENHDEKALNYFHNELHKSELMDSAMKIDYVKIFAV